MDNVVVVAVHVVQKENHNKREFKELLERKRAKACGKRTVKAFSVDTKNQNKNIPKMMMRKTFQFVRGCSTSRLKN